MKLSPTNALGLLMIFGLASAMADPIPDTVIGPGGALLNVQVNMQSSKYPVSFQFSPPGYGTFTGTGGGFAATVDGYSTIVWCVDSEEDISIPTSYQADLVRLSTVAANSNDVQYGNVTGSAWDLPWSGYNSALFRYEAAAYLVGQYEGFPKGPSSNDLTDQELQTAAWELIYNNSVTAGYGITFSQIQTGGSTFSGSTLTTFENQVSSDIANAENCVLNRSTCPSFNPDTWGVLSGPVDSSGNLNQHPGNQTYLVQLAPVPEPSSVGLFAGVLLICGLLLRRRLLV